MKRSVQAASSAIVTAIVMAATPASAAESVGAAQASTELAPIAMDQFGNLNFAGTFSDELLSTSYGPLLEEGLLGFDVNIGKCTITNNCKPPEKPSGQ